MLNIKYYLIGILISVCGTLFAEDFKSIVIQKNDAGNTKEIIDINNFNSISFKNNAITIYNNAQIVKEVSLNDVEKVYFEESVNSITNTNDTYIDEEYEIYNINGTFVSSDKINKNTKNNLKKGVYIIKTDKGTKKIFVK